MAPEQKAYFRLLKLLEQHPENKLSKTAYIFTPLSIRHRMELTQGCIERKKAEYQALGAELEDLGRKIVELPCRSHHNLKDLS